MELGFKHTAYAVLATATLLSSFGFTTTAFAATSASGTQYPLAEQQKVPAGQLQEAQALRIVHSEVLPALAQFELGDFFKTLTKETASYNSGGVMFQFPTWDIHLAQPVTKPGPEVATMNVTLDARTGELVSFDVQNPDWQCTEGPSTDLAIAKADAFLKQFEPSLYTSVKVSQDPLGATGVEMDSPTSKPYSFFYTEVNFYKMVNGLPFKANSIRVNVDKYGHIVGMSKQFPVDSSKLPSASSAISLDQANKIYADALHMQKYYQTGHMQKQADGTYAWQENPKLIYIPNYLSPLDAVTGKFVGGFPMDSQKQPPVELQITGAGDSWNANQMDTLKKEISDLTQVDLSKLTYYDKVNNLANKDDSTVSWNEPTEPHRMGLYVVYDKSSGQVITLQNFAANNMNESDDQLQPSNGKSDPNITQPAPPITLQQGEATVEKWLSTLLPNGSQEVFLTSESDSRDDTKYPSWFDFSKADQVHVVKPTYSYSFNLGHQGVPILDQSITLELDPYTGALLQMTRQKTQSVPLPDNKYTVSEDQVKQDFLKAHPLQLYYNWSQYELQWAPSGQMLYNVQYTLSSPYSYDAFTGEAIPLNR